MKAIALAALVSLLALAVVVPAAPDDPKNGKKEVAKAPAKGVRPTNLDVNTKADEDEPHVPGTNTLYYSSNASGKFRIMLSTRANPLNRWGKGKATVDDFETVEDKSCFFVAERTTGFQYFFFATLRDKDAKNYDIFAVQRTGPNKSWSALTGVQSVCTDEDELHPWVTADRKTIYFSRKTKDGWRVFSVTRPTAVGPQFQGEATLVKELPPGFHHATLTPDGRTMYLQGPLENDRSGLFVSTKTGKEWGQPVALDMLNNSERPIGDRSPCLSPDGALLYFASDRPGGKGGLDLWVIPTGQLKVR